MSYEIREAVYADYKAIAKIHISAWQQAYRGLVPDDHLDNLSLEKGEMGWKRRLKEKLNKLTIVAVNEENVVLGYCCGGDNRAEPRVYDGELQAIYIHPDYWGLGIGKVMFKEFKKRLQYMGYKYVIEWVFKRKQCAGVL